MPTPYTIAGPDGTPTDDACEHAAEIKDVVPSTTEGCEDCLREGTSWVHLRICLTCGHVGCCDSSPRRHARAHWNATEHPVMASREPGEDWAWCFPEETLLLPRKG
ncbi:UBP-type zinc finger domain-containing protein [Streptomyces luteireticuli]|uniref:UBP-type zinc finger domain-containing protein n=1 Tax=Streptomyces luteireticuli TaxID=173858 RepID=A0ABN0YNH4_9ACTN